MSNVDICSCSPHLSASTFSVSTSASTPSAIDPSAEPSSVASKQQAPQRNNSNSTTSRVSSSAREQPTDPVPVYLDTDQRDRTAAIKTLPSKRTQTCDTPSMNTAKVRHRILPSQQNDVELSLSSPLVRVDNIAWSISETSGSR